MPPLSRQFVLRRDSDAQQLYSFLKANRQAMAEADTPLLVTVETKRAKRSAAQNRYLHLILTRIAQAAWVNGRQYDLETWKEHFRRTLIGTEEIDLPDGSRTIRGISTTTLCIGKCQEFLEGMLEYARDELGLPMDMFCFDI